MPRIREVKFRNVLLASLVVLFGVRGIVKADDKPSFQVAPSQVEHLVGKEEPDFEFVDIMNTGKTVIREIKYSGRFRSGKSTIFIPPTAADLPVDGIQPSNQISIKVKMSRPFWAGSYSGSLQMTSPGADSKSVAVIIRSRGPLPNVPFGESPFYELPGILFIAVVLVGFGVSSLLDQWMGTDLPRLRALQSLRDSLTTASNISERIRKWPLDHPSLSGWPLTMNRIAILVPDLTRVITGASQASPADLTAAGQTYSLISAKLLIFSSALDLIESLYSQKGNDPSNLAYLNSAIKRLDSLDFSDATQIATFRANVVNALSAASTSGGGVVIAAPAAADKGVMETLQIEATQKKTKRTIWLITAAQHAVVWVVVVLTGLTTYFLANATYGSATDYIGTMLWSLGLTQTGKQIIARPR